MASDKKQGGKGGKKLRRCVQNKKITDRTQQKAYTRAGYLGPLHKKNGEKSRLPVFKPNPKIVEFYEQMDSPFIQIGRR